MAAGAVESHLHEVGFRLFAGTEVYLTALVENAYLVEDLTVLADVTPDARACDKHDNIRSVSTHIISTLRRLINSHHGRRPHQIRRLPDRLTELNRIRTIQASRTIIPTLQRRRTQRRLGNRNTLPLTPTHAPHVIVPDAGIDRMADAEGGHDHVAQCAGVVDAADAAGDMARRACDGGEFEGLPDTEHGEVYVYFGGVGGFAAEVFVHGLG